MEIVDGSKIFEEIKKEVSREVAHIIDNNKKSPHIAAIVIGDDEMMIEKHHQREKMLEEVGIMYSVYKSFSKVKEEELLDIIQFINEDDEVDGVIIQLPLPAHISADKIIQKIKPEKDIEGVHSVNIERYKNNKPTYLQELPSLIQQIFIRYNINSKNTLIIQDKKGEPGKLDTLLSLNIFSGNNKVIVSHRDDEDFRKNCSEADVMIIDVGMPGFITAEMIKKNTVLIDLGRHKIISKISETGFEIVGDVNYNDVSKKCSLLAQYSISIEPLLITSLMINTMKAVRKEIVY